MNHLYEPPLESFFEYDPYEDYVHIDELGKYYDAEGLIKKIIDNLYKTGNVLQFEDDFEELANIFNISLPLDEIKIKNKGDNDERFRK